MDVAWYYFIVGTLFGCYLVLSYRWCGNYVNKLVKKTR